MSPVARAAPGRLVALGRLLAGHLPARRNARLQDLATGILRDDSDSVVLKVLNASLVARRSLSFWCRLEPRRMRSRARFARSGLAADVPRRALSLLCPTRGRVAGLRAFLRSVDRTAAAPGRVEVLCYVDDDDPDLPRYRELVDRARSELPGLGGCRLVVGPPQGVPAAWNELARQARGDLLMMANDDQIYVDRGWDVLLDRRVDELTLLNGDDVCCLYFDGGQYDGGCDFPIVSRSWYRALGYFVPTRFQQWEVETWVFDVAFRAGRCHPVPGVFVEHRHYQDYKAPFDATYQRHRMTREKSLTDHALFLRTGAERAADAQRLVQDPTGAASEPSPHPEPARRSAPWFLDHLASFAPTILEEVARWSSGVESGPDVELTLLRGGEIPWTGRERCPRTADLLDAIPELWSSPRGGASVTRLEPGAGRDHAPLAGVDRTVHVWLRAGPGSTVRDADRTRPCVPGEVCDLPGHVAHRIDNLDASELLALTLRVPAVDHGTRG